MNEGVEVLQKGGREKFAERGCMLPAASVLEALQARAWEYPK